MYTIGTSQYTGTMPLMGHTSKRLSIQVIRYCNQLEHKEHFKPKVESSNSYSVKVSSKVGINQRELSATMRCEVSSLQRKQTNKGSTRTPQ